MSVSTVAVLAILATATVASAQAQGPEVPMVIVQGEGVVRVAPDQAVVRTGAESRARAPRDAQAANAAA